MVEDIKAIGQLIATVGFPIVLLLMMAFGLWKGMGWVGDKMLKPLFDRTILFLDALQKNVEETTATIRVMRQSQEEMNKAIQAAACRYPIAKPVLGDNQGGKV